MRWEDERYVRVYTREEIDWVMLPWEARVVFWEVLRKCDRAGLLRLGKHGAKGLAELIRIPSSVVELALPDLLEDGCVRMVDDGKGGKVLFVPNFIAAQEAIHSDKARKRAQRERDAAKAHAKSLGIELDEAVTACDPASQNVTKCHEVPSVGHVESQPVTPCCAVPSRAVPEEPPLPPAGAGGSASPPAMAAPRSPAALELPVPAEPAAPSAAPPTPPGPPAAADRLELVPEVPKRATRKPPGGPPLAELMALWNERAARPMPRVLEPPGDLSRPMRKSLETRALNGPGGWSEVIDRMNVSPWCLGEARNSERPMDFRFMLRHAADVLNGAYDGRRAGPPPSAAEEPPEAPRPAPPPADDCSVWGRVLHRLREDLPAYAIDNWFAKVREADLDDARLTLQVPTLHVRDWILDHYGDRIREAVAEVAGRSLDLVFAAGEVAAPQPMKAA